MLRVILLTIKFFRFTDEISWAQIFLMGSWMGWQYSAGKTLVSDLWSISEFIGNNFTDGFIDCKSVQKKIYPLYPLIFLLMNITYHRQKNCI